MHCMHYTYIACSIRMVASTTFLWNTAIVQSPWPGLANIDYVVAVATTSLQQQCPSTLRFDRSCRCLLQTLTCSYGRCAACPRPRPALDSGLIMERMNPPDRRATNWEPFIFGTVVGWRRFVISRINFKHVLFPTSRT
jgi:hypothetical protein